MQNKKKTFFNLKELSTKILQQASHLQKMKITKAFLQNLVSRRPHLRKTDCPQTSLQKPRDWLKIKLMCELSRQCTDCVTISNDSSRDLEPRHKSKSEERAKADREGLCPSG